MVVSIHFNSFWTVVKSKVLNGRFVKIYLIVLCKICQNIWKISPKHYSSQYLTINVYVTCWSFIWNQWYLVIFWGRINSLKIRHCPSVTLSFVLMYSSGRLDQSLYQSRVYQALDREFPMKLAIVDIVFKPLSNI